MSRSLDNIGKREQVRLAIKNKYMHTSSFWVNNGRNVQDTGLVCTAETSPDMHFG